MAHARIPHEQIGVPITETSFELQPHHRSRRSHSSVRGTARLSLSFLGQPEQNSSSQGGSVAESEEAEYGYASASSQESQQGSSSPLPEVSIRKSMKCNGKMHSVEITKAVGRVPAKKMLRMILLP
ncbi:unnamed protein product [Gongylonema pulchrum]|uniref:Uncharacterized protein n=1 Tax=Gongylonema pulchrum TaxID=637853 RepID=A0A3P6SHK4_9BILA|nr:unnamed protein product [Gongylonema pulchrum]